MRDKMLIMLLVALACLGILYHKMKTETFMPGLYDGMSGTPPVFYNMRVLFPAVGMPFPGMAGAIPMGGGGGGGGGGGAFMSWPPQPFDDDPRVHDNMINYERDGIPRGYPPAKSTTAKSTTAKSTTAESTTAKSTTMSPAIAGPSLEASQGVAQTATPTSSASSSSTAQVAPPAPRTKLMEKSCINASDPNNRIYSANGLFVLEILKNGGLELWKIKTAFGTDHDGTSPLWSNGVSGAESPDTRLCLEDDGKLAVYKSADKSQVLWTGSFADILKFTEYGVFEGFANNHASYQEWEAFDATNPDYALVISDQGVLQQTEDETSIVWQAKQGDPAKGAVQNPKIPLNAGRIAKVDQRTVLGGTGSSLCMSAFGKDGNNRLYSPNGKFALEISIDGTLAAWGLDDAGNHAGEPLWYSSRIGHEKSVDHELCMQEDGNLVVYYDPDPKGTKKVPLWSSNTRGQKHTLVITDTGRVEMKNAQNQIVWFADGSSPRTPDGISRGSNEKGVSAAVESCSNEMKLLASRLTEDGTPMYDGYNIKANWSWVSTFVGCQGRSYTIEYQNTFDRVMAEVKNKIIPVGNGEYWFQLDAITDIFNTNSDIVEMKTGKPVDVWNTFVPPDMSNMPKMYIENNIKYVHFSGIERLEYNVPELPYPNNGFTVIMIARFPHSLPDETFFRGGPLYHWKNAEDKRIDMQLGNDIPKWTKDMPWFKQSWSFIVHRINNNTLTHQKWYANLDDQNGIVKEEMSLPNSINCNDIRNFRVGFDEDKKTDGKFDLMFMVCYPEYVQDDVITELYTNQFTTKRALAGEQPTPPVRPALELEPPWLAVETHEPVATPTTAPFRRWRR